MEYKRVKISEICSSICSGGTPKSTIPEYYGGNIPWLNTKEINFNRIYNTEKSITKEGLINSSAKWIEENSVVVAMYGATAGKSAITKIPLTTNQACCNITVNNSKADYRFVYYALYNDYKCLASLANGGAQQNLNAQLIKDFDIPNFPLNEQIKIANLISTLDDKIELNRRINDNLEQQAQALYKSWFVDFEPFKGEKFVDSELGKIPEGWRVGKIGNYCKVRSGYAFKSSWWTDKGCKVIKIKNITEESKLDLNNCSHVLESNTIKASDFMVSAGDVLIAMTGATIGKFCIVPYLQNNTYVNQRVGKFFLGNDPIKKLPFLYNTLKQGKVLSEIISKGQGSAQPNISGLDIENISIIQPTNELIQSFNALLIPLYLLMLKNEQENIVLANKRDSLLPKLMSGELKTGDLHR
jgi:type I restriction enzyme S subunit